MKKISLLLITILIIVSMSIKVLGAETKIYTLKDYEGEHTMTVTGVVSDTVSGIIEEYQSNIPTISITTDSTITYDFAMYGVTVYDSNQVRVFDENSKTGDESDLEFVFAFKVTNDKVLTQNEEEAEKYEKGYTIQFIKTGTYSLSYWNEAGSAGAVTLIVTDGSASTPQEPTDNKILATPTNSKVLVNGSPAEFDSYTINGNNYFKLRDIAMVISGSAKQFDVSWDNDKNAINLISNKAYTVAGGELLKGDGTDKNAIACSSAILKDGTTVSLTAYTINGNNYFKLRDLGQSFDFDVSWDNASNCITIDTTNSYTED